MKEYLPAGTTFVEGSVNSQASHHYTVEDGVLTLYFTPDQHPNVVYEVYGYLPRPVPRPAPEPVQRV